MRNFLKSLDGCGLIYCATRENTELVADYLKLQGLSVTAYHAGYDSEEKIRLQKEFIADKYKVLASTNALGMGIDKGNLRFIIHFDVPGSITAYYQEVGRCGRDGQNAEGIILYDYNDKFIQEYRQFSTSGSAEKIFRTSELLFPQLYRLQILPRSNVSQDYTLPASLLLLQSLLSKDLEK